MQTTTPLFLSVQSQKSQGWASIQELLQDEMGNVSRKGKSPLVKSTSKKPGLCFMQLISSPSCSVSPLLSCKKQKGKTSYRDEIYMQTPVIGSLMGIFATLRSPVTSMSIHLTLPLGASTLFHGAILKGLFLSKPLWGKSRSTSWANIKAFYKKPAKQTEIAWGQRLR